MSNGPDLTVKTWLPGDPGSVQWAVDNVTDTTGDGNIIVLVIAHPDGSLGGTSNQKVVVSATYRKPFGLFGCSVTLTGGGTGPAVWIKDSATSPNWRHINGRTPTSSSWTSTAATAPWACRPTASTATCATKTAENNGIGIKVTATTTPSTTAPPDKGGNTGDGV